MNKTREILSKLIFFYSLFYVVIKFVAVVFKNAWLWPNVILTLPYLVFAIIGAMMMKNNTYSWFYAISGLIVISIVRYFEQDWAAEMHRVFTA